MLEVYLETNLIKLEIIESPLLFANLHIIENV